MIHKIYRDFPFMFDLEEKSDLINSPWLELKFYGGSEGLPDQSPPEILPLFIIGDLRK